MKIFILVGFITAQVFCLNVFDAVGAVTTATGGSGRGAVEPVDGVLLNPAIISDLPMKNFSVNYSLDQQAISISDNGKDAYFPAAFVFQRLTTDTIDTKQLGISVATYRWHRLVVGANFSVIDYLDHTVPGFEHVYHQPAADLGSSLAVTDNFGMGLVFNKIASNKVDLAENLQTQKTTALGISYIFQGFARFRFDVESAPENKTDRLVYMAGMENFINDWIVIRTGYQNNNVLNKNFISAGVGFAGPQFGLHYAYISNPADKTEDKHLIDLGIPF